ncbi:MAG: hypothetical protein ABIR24_05190 [Verrucomicrobiota bacterium]
MFFALLSPIARAGNYALLDGGSVSGDPISFNETGLIVRQSDGNVSLRTAWAKFTQPALKQLAADAKSEKDKDFVEPFIEDSPQNETKRREVVIKQVPLPERPTGNVGLSAAFSSPVFQFIFFVLYLANLYAAYEIAFYKNRPPLLVCGVSAIVPFIGPIIFLCIPGNVDPMEGQTLVEALAPPPATVEEIPVAEGSLIATPVSSEVASDESNPLAQPAAQSTLPRPTLKIAHSEPEPAAPAFPAPIVFHRGEFSFNRRFFETKLPGFFRIVPGEAEKDMMLTIKAVRGEFTGKRISRVTQNELYLQVFKDEASHDEMLPFAEILEVRIRHKDAA